MYVHNRRSLRLRRYDYAQAGAYFVTICTQDRACLFGDAVGEDMVLNNAGRMVRSVWEGLPDRFSGMELDAFVVMPNHVHAIITIPGRGESRIRPGDCHQQESGDHKDRPYGTMAGSLGRMMQAFKSTATHEYVTGVRQHLWPPFCARLWQRNYYEHVIQNERELDKIREYIATNPLKWALDRENPQRTERSVEEDTLFDINRPQVSRRGNQNQRPQSPAVG
jgi:putative transposase